ncbi:MAG: prepilin-type N-terminal cleavage/methylation domain-containing protein [Pirellulales bacterium]
MLLNESRATRRALTLIEVLVALAAAMVILAAVVNVLGMATKGIADSRSIVEATNRLRSAQHLLRMDLSGATCPGIVWQRGEMGNGYFEAIEGPLLDSANSSSANAATSMGGDPDDVLFFTTRSLGQPFSGKVNGATYQSDKAEVVWFMTPMRTFTTGQGDIQVYALRRRVFLILNENAGITPSGSNTTPTENFDVSFRQGTSGNVLNTLGSLGNRRNRIYHNSGTTNCFQTPAGATAPSTMAFATGGNREGEDIVLTNVLSFDVKVFDPTAPIKQQTGVAGMGLIPGDVGYPNTTSTNTGASGAFVNLGQENFSNFTRAMGSGKPGSAVTVTGLPTYDTWTFDYENDGVAQGTSGSADPAVNGKDDNNDGVVDDANERETYPPYPYPLRGIQVKIRVYDPVSKSVRETTIEETFVQ